MELLLPVARAEPAAAPLGAAGPAPQAAPEPTRHESAVDDGESVPQGPPAHDHETRTGGAGGNEHAEGEAEADAEHERVTDKGLPKRTPKITAPETVPRQRSGSVDAAALRRRLGGFRQGAQAGYREVEAEIAEQTASHKRPATGTSGPAESEEATGGTAEEASS